MVEITVISGKGGTGKTSLTGAFAQLADDLLICDLDVDAPDLHLLLHPESQRREDFRSGHGASIRTDDCIACGLCAEMCQFDAIIEDESGLTVDPLACEGCSVCVAFCPVDAIDFPEQHCGEWYISSTRFGPMVHAQLFPGQENSGLLVSLLRKQARALAKERGLSMILADGAPGIGCPVISSLTGTDLVLVVTEPTPSGRHDLERVADLAAHFKIPTGVIINKHDLNPDQTRGIERYCRGKRLEVVAKLAHDPAITEAMVRGLVITEYQSGGLADQVRQAWDAVLALVELVAQRHQNSHGRTLN